MLKKANVASTLEFEDDEAHTPLGYCDTARCSIGESAVGLTAARVGTTCQRIFEEAYVHASGDSSAGRAAFLAYVDMSQQELPKEVLSFCHLLRQRQYDQGAQCVKACANPDRRLCMACMTDATTWSALVKSYRFIHPDIMGMPVRPIRSVPDTSARILEELFTSIVNGDALYLDELGLD
jgi:hypothetical protein